MRVQVKKGGMVTLPGQAMEFWGIGEWDFLECSLTQAGILFTPIVLTGSVTGHKKNCNKDRMFW